MWKDSRQIEYKSTTSNTLAVKRCIILAKNNTGSRKVLLSANEIIISFVSEISSQCKKMYKVSSYYKDVDIYNYTSPIT